MNSPRPVDGIVSRGRERRASAVRALASVVLALVVVLVGTAVYGQWALGRARRAVASAFEASSLPRAVARTAPQGSAVMINGVSIGTIVEIVGLRDDAAADDSLMLFVAELDSNHADMPSEFFKQLHGRIHHSPGWRGPVTITLSEAEEGGTASPIGRLLFRHREIAVPITSARTSRP